MDHKLVNTASKQLHFAQHMGNYAVKSRRQSFSYIRKKEKKGANDPSSCKKANLEAR
jgi:hypothetical protein